MARSRFNNITSDAINDGGTVLISLVQGEQIELPVIVDFIEDPTLYNYEAALVEADNQAEQTTPPVKIKGSPTKSTLTVRIPSWKGVWSASTAYTTGNLVSVNGSIYERIGYAANVVDSESPSTPDSTKWMLSHRGKLFIQLTSDLSSTYLPPSVGSPSYGFLELRVTEKAGAFPRTYKPIRGVVEFLFSPTHITPDI